MAEAVVGDVDAFRRPFVSSRPTTVPNDDAQCADAVRSNAPPHWVHEYAVWRYHVAAVEAKGARSVEILVRAHASFVALDAATFAPQIARLEQFLADEYGASPPYPSDPTQLRKMAAAVNRRRDLISTWALNGEEQRE